MGLIGDYRRLMRAGIALARHDVILPGAYQTRLPLPARIAGRILRIFGGGARGRPGERLARALEKLGPAYIKLGQFLATRPDVFGAEVTQDLGRLKDKLPVHKMSLPEGERAVKILRPGIEHKLMVELSAMKRAARTIEGISAESQRLKPVAFTETIAAAMMRETDLRLEAGGADEMHEISQKSGHFVIPSVDWDRTGRRVLTIDWIDGISLTDPKALDRPGIDRKKLANDITQGFLTHAIEYGVFHADMHEGNLIITPEGKVALVDFGIIGRIGMVERRFLAEILWGFLKRDYLRVAEVHFEAGYVPASQSVGEFAQALRSIGEPVHGKPAEEVSMGRVLLQLFDYTHTFGMSLRPELVLLQKTMVQVEGVARAIDPSHNIWVASEPVVGSWIRRSFGPEGAAKLVAGNVKEITNRLKRLPEVMDRFEASLEPPAPPPPPPRRFAPWWGWFGFVAILVALGIWAAK